MTKRERIPARWGAMILLIIALLIWGILEAKAELDWFIITQVSQR
jgi:hypothetical protein